MSEVKCEEDIEDLLHESYMVLDETEKNPSKDTSDTKEDTDVKPVELPESGGGDDKLEKSSDLNEEAPSQKDEDAPLEEEEEEEGEEGDCVEITDEEPDATEPEKQADPEVKVKEKNGEQVEESVETNNDNETVIDSHPYLYLIDSYELTHEQKTVTNIGPPKSVQDTPLHLVTTRMELLNLLQSLRKAKEIALDVQVDKKFFQGAICLMEIGTREADYVIDAVKLKNDLLLLTEIFINPNIVKIVYRADVILAPLQQCMHLFVINIFDICQAEAAIGGITGCFNARLKHKYDVKRDNKHFSADFRVRPLPEHLINFCRTSVHYMIYMYHDYKDQLIKDENLYKTVMDNCRNISKQLYPSSTTTVLETFENQLKSIHACQSELLPKLYNWRNDVAKKTNKNPDVILPRSCLINLVLGLPVTEASVMAIGNSSYLQNDIQNIIGIICQLKAKYQVNKRLGYKKGPQDNVNKFQGIKRKFGEYKSEMGSNQTRRNEFDKSRETAKSPVAKKQQKNNSPLTKNFYEQFDKNKKNEPHNNKELKQNVQNNNRGNQNFGRFSTGQKEAKNFAQNQSRPYGMFNSPFNNNRGGNRKARFGPSMGSKNSKMFKSTDVPSNIFQSGSSLQNNPFQGVNTSFTSPLSSLFTPNFNRGKDQHQKQNMGFGGFNQNIDDIDHQINRMERGMSRFQPDPNDIELDVFRRRYN